MHYYGIQPLLYATPIKTVHSLFLNVGKQYNWKIEKE